MLGSETLQRDAGAFGNGPLDQPAAPFGETDGQLPGHLDQPPKASVAFGRRTVPQAKASPSSCAAVSSAKKVRVLDGSIASTVSAIDTGESRSSAGRAGWRGIRGMY